MNPLQEELKIGFPHRLLSPFVLKHGQAYQNQPLPKGFRRMTPKACYLNSFLTARKHGLVYVEGYALMDCGVSFSHAWCAEPGSKLVIDVTTDKFIDFYGIPFDIAFVKAFYKRKGKGCWSLLDEWEDDFPILKTDPALFLYKDANAMSSQAERFKVFVPHTGKVNGRKISHVTYPCKGHPLYTREQAIDVLRRFYTLSPWTEGAERECWAESDNSRFTLHIPENLLETN